MPDTVATPLVFSAFQGGLPFEGPSPPVALVRLTRSYEVFLLLRPVVNFTVEEFWLVGLRANKALIDKRCLFRGTVDECLVHPREVFREVCLMNASCFAVAHSHPSGDPEPSPADFAVTKRLLEASRIFQIPLIDHLVLTETRYQSFADRGWLLIG